MHSVGTVQETWMASLRRANSRVMRKKTMEQFFHCNMLELCKQRNRKSFEGKEIPVRVLEELTMQDALLWMKFSQQGRNKQIASQKNLMNIVLKRILTGVNKSENLLFILSLLFFWWRVKMLTSITISDFNVNLDLICSSSSLRTPRSITLNFFRENLLPEIKCINSLNNMTYRNSNLKKNSDKMTIMKQK